MSISFDGKTKTFHLKNRFFSYVMKILPNGQIGQLYFGKTVEGGRVFDYLPEPAYRPMSSYVSEGEYSFSLEHVRQEYPSYGTGDFRHPSVGIRSADGSRISGFAYEGHRITAGKPELSGLPATWCEDEKEAETLAVTLRDPLTGVEAELLYTVFAELPVLARSVRITNEGPDPVHVEQAMSLCLDLPDANYDWIQFSGAWARERHVRTRRLQQGIQSVESTRGNSSHVHNPFVILKRPETTELSGEAYGFSLIYSGNFLAQAEVDTWDVTRFTMGINPFGFDWKLEQGEALQLPEAVMVYTESGLNAMSHAFHTLYRTRLARGYWQTKERPILINSWECMTFDITEERLVRLARKAKRCGIELFVLDDGWFKGRDSDRRGLGDWHEVRECLPGGIDGLARKIEAEGLKFGLWIEPEMMNRDSDLFRAHEDWLLRAPGRSMTHCRNEFALDLGRQEVVDYLFDMLSGLIGGSHISYIKWDMNRSITEAYSAALPPERQGEVMHRYILGLYQLYGRLVQAFPEVLFESCASGGGRFDPGMLYYAPQAWLSDDSDAAERILMQYGTSYCYPLSSFGTHVSSVPNGQIYRYTPLHTRANVAFFGTYGYELDLEELTEEELDQIRMHTEFMKKYRRLFLTGTFYRLVSPFDGKNLAAWMVVSEDKKTAVAGWYKLLNEVNGPYHRLHMCGLDSSYSYCVEQTDRYSREMPYMPYSAEVADPEAVPDTILTGDELMKVGLPVSDCSAGEKRGALEPSCDFDSRLYVMHAV